jgi:hypothetical protein
VNQLFLASSAPAAIRTVSVTDRHDQRLAAVMLTLATSLLISA